MSTEEYLYFMKTVHRDFPGRTTEVTNNIISAWRKIDKKKVEVPSGSSGQGRKLVSCLPTPSQQGCITNTMQKMEESTSSSGQRSKLVSCLPNPSQLESKVDPKEKVEEASCSSGQESKLMSCLYLPWQQSAWKTGFIFRGDKVPNNGRLFFDVEKVTMKLTEGHKKHEQKAATICLVNEDAKVVLWAFIRIQHDDVCQYCYRITKLDQQKLALGIPLQMVHKCLDICLTDNILVGAAVQNDFKSLDYEHNSVFDLQSVYKDIKGPFALAHIIRTLCSNRTGFQAGHHTAIDDARMTLKAYLHYREREKAGKFQDDLYRLTNSREEFKKRAPKYYSEKCRCSNA